VVLIDTSPDLDFLLTSALDRRRLVHCAGVPVGLPPDVQVTERRIIHEGLHMSDGEGAGIASYQGYEFQILATVWVALDLIVRRRLCERIDVEPASAEDIAANLRVESEAASATVGVPVGGLAPVELQIKLRSTQWTQSTFKAVLAGDGTKTSMKGPPPRPRALSQLQCDPTKRYTLLTNAQVSGDLSDFVVAEVGQESKATKPPSDLKPDTADIAKRIGILAQKTQELLRHDIREILQRAAHVPYTKVKACTEALERAVRERLLGRDPNAWTRDQIEAEIASHDGYPERRAPGPFVPPDPFDEYRDQLAKGALLLTGPAGSGKTHTADHLAHELRTIDDAFEVVEIASSEGIGRIRSLLRAEGRHLFFVHDPWGKFERSDRAQEWATELPKLVRDATTDKRFLVTSRTAILPPGTSTLQTFEHRLTDSDYSAASRGKILDLAMASAQPRLKDYATKHRARILDRLRLPYAIDVFARRLRATAIEPEPNLEELLAASNVEVVADTIFHEITAVGREAVAAAVPLWTLLMSRRSLTREEIAAAGRYVRAGGYRDPVDPVKLLNRLNAGGWLTEHRSNEHLIAHPSVQEGLELAVNSEPALTEEVLIAMLTGLVADNKLKAAARIVRQLLKRQTPVPRAAQEALNRHLLNRVLKTDGYEAGQAFRELKELSDSKDPASELVRLLVTLREHRVIGQQMWRPPELSGDQIKLIWGSEEARAVGAQFVRHALPETDSFTYQAGPLVDFFAQFGWEFSTEFLAAFHEHFRRGSTISGVLAEGALRGPAPKYDEVLDSALRERDETFAWLAAGDEERRKAEQAEVNAIEASHVLEEPSERFYPIDEVLRVAVTLRRHAQGYDWLLKHLKRAALLESWAKTIHKRTAAQEVRALLKACPAGERSPGWQAVAKSANCALGPEVVAALREGPDPELPDVLEAFVAVVADFEWEAALAKASEGLGIGRKVQIADAIRQTHSLDDEVRESLVEAVLGSKGKELFNLLCSVDERPDEVTVDRGAVGADGVELLRTLSKDGEMTSAVRACVVLSKLGEPVSEQLPRFLGSKDLYVRQFGLYLVAKAGGSAQREHLRRALEDEDYRCRRAAMSFLAPDASDAERKLIIGKETDASAPIREHCARLIGWHKWEEGQAALTKMLHDKRDKNEAAPTIFVHAAPDLHVARAAAQALYRFDNLPADRLTEVESFIRTAGASCPDLVVHGQLVDLLGNEGDAAVVPTLLGLLADKRHMPGTSGEGFPLRFAATRALVFKLLNHPEIREQMPVDSLLEGARHDDGRLAGPSLMALGLLGARAHPHLLGALRDHKDSADRAALLLVAAALVEPPGPEPRVEQFADPSHPSRALIALAASPPKDDDAWKDWLAEHTPIHEWVTAIQPTEGINPTLRFALHLLFEQKLDHLLGWPDLAKRDFATSIPLMTMRSMFGGE